MRITPQEFLDLIYKQTRVKLTLCEDFPGIMAHGTRTIFHAILSDNRVSESADFDTLSSFAKRYSDVLHCVEPAGLNRIALFVGDKYM